MYSKNENLIIYTAQYPEVLKSSKLTHAPSLPERLVTDHIAISMMKGLLG